jgi:hypothetical protein
MRSAGAAPLERIALTATAPDDAVQAPGIADEGEEQTLVEVLCRFADRDMPAADVEVFPLALTPELVVELETALTSGSGLEQLLRGRVNPVRTDALGHARVRVSSAEELAAVALAPGYSGISKGGPVTGQLRIELHREQRVEVLVLDSQGAPVEGAVVSLCVSVDTYRMDMLSCSTDSAGRGTIALAGQMLEAQQGQDLLLRVKGLFQEPQEQPLDLEAELARFQLPPCGWIELQCEPPAASTEALVVSLSRLDASGKPIGEGLEALMGPAGRLRLGPVALNQQFAAKGLVVGSEVPWLASGPGPVKSGESAVFKLSRGAVLQLRGLALGPDAQPMERARIAAELWRPEEAPQDPDEVTREQLRCDGEGRFTWDLPSDTRGATRARFTISRRGLIYTAEIPLPEESSGSVDVGAIRFQELPPLASGRVVDAAGQALRGVNCALMQVESWGAGISTQRELRAARSDQQGRFVLHAPWVSGPLELSLRAEGYATREIKLQQPGDLGDVTLQRAARLLGQVLLGSGAKTQEFHVLCYAQANERFQAALDEAGRFALGGLSAGTYRLSLGGGGLLGGDRPLWSAVEFSADSGDLDLGSIDLTGQLLRTDLRVQDPSGAAITSIALASPDPGTQFFNNWNSLELAQGQTSYLLWHASDIQRARVQATGFRSAFVELAGGRVDLTLTPALVAELRLSNFAQIPKGLRLYAYLRGLDPGSPGTVQPLTQASSRVYFELPGTYTVTFQVLPQNEFWSSPSSEGPRQQFELLDLAKPQAFEFELPAELLAEAQQLVNGK